MFRGWNVTEKLSRECESNSFLRLKLSSDNVQINLRYFAITRCCPEMEILNL
jgi:hypothetical protein